ncbi:hypothetical protein [Microbacterium sp. NPDC076911]
MTTAVVAAQKLVTTTQLPVTGGSNTAAMLVATRAAVLPLSDCA